MEHDLMVHALRMMERYGGGFAGALAVAWQRADADNQARLEKAFPDLLQRYAEFPRESV